jgi:hypothetical protein
MPLVTLLAGLIVAVGLHSADGSANARAATVTHS